MSSSPTTKGYDVYVNNAFKGFIIGQSKASRLNAVRHLVTSTHMGDWRRDLIPLDGGQAHGYLYEYATTIGIYIKFYPCKRLSESLGNYRLEA